MAILGTQTTSTLSTGGVTENNIPILQTSPLHDLASVDGQGLAQINPAITDQQPANPTALKSLTGDKYLDNLPR
jgi:hypothetical protein